MNPCFFRLFVFLQLDEVWTKNFGYTSIATSKDLPYTKFLTHAIYKMIDNRLFEQLSKKWAFVEPSCDEGNVNQMGIEKLASLFMILGIGILLAVICLSIEKRLKKTNLGERHQKNDVQYVALNMKMRFTLDEVNRLEKLLHKDEETGTTVASRNLEMQNLLKSLKDAFVRH